MAEAKVSRSEAPATVETSGKLPGIMQFQTVLSALSSGVASLSSFSRSSPASSPNLAEVFFLVLTGLVAAR
ncbi:protein of unknown function (plasmid) [Agrobacterium pusense]|uniref:Uncharacterized protein n=1 Tax=Agrobacterium pusense TaxID=648995 RepID=U4Q4H9_9HYPH|nr:protein of unknown function [Agrobacterium pusense]